MVKVFLIEFVITSKTAHRLLDPNLYSKRNLIFNSSKKL